MSMPYGQTRTRVAARHALIAPDGHVKSNVPGITGAATIILINEAMGAKFAQLLVTFEKGGRGVFRRPEIETFGYVMSGEVTLMLAGGRERCTAGGYFFSPAGQMCEVVAQKPDTKLTLFQKKFAALPGAATPRTVVSSASKVKGQAFLGDPDARLQVLLPDEPAFDLAVNVFTYQPGATLPFVETHVMEHGLIMLRGQGVYRLEDAWYPVAAGDVIWMAPFCPQWFVAMGKSPASYLYYKDVNRAAI